ncbi:hypothetical protein J6590_093077 [Homalodisca vitripennis]|nr:hypothetical protein J6590_093077 [Homalodisca vitripennis]
MRCKVLTRECYTPHIEEVLPTNLNIFWTCVKTMSRDQDSSLAFVSYDGVSSIDDTSASDLFAAVFLPAPEHCMLGLIYCLRRTFRSIRSLELFYCSFDRPHLEYCSVFWAPQLAYYISSLLDTASLLNQSSLKTRCTVQDIINTA